MKIYDDWNNLKQIIASQAESPFCNQREIWWCSVGMNVGTELYGKNELFERPIIILKVYNIDTVLTLPITSSRKDGRYYYKIKFNLMNSSVVLSQPRTLSTKRLTRRISRLPESEFTTLLDKFISSIKNETPQ